MYKIIAIMGKAGSGKDSLMQTILTLHPGFHEIISCTSRPMREGEADGVNYFYYTVEEFCDKILKEQMLESTVFNNWFYGTSYDSIEEDKINIGVFNPTGVETLQARDDVDIKIIWVEADDKERMRRQLEREEDPDVEEIVRRWGADSADFKDIENNINSYFKVYNEKNSDLLQLARIILDSLSSWIND